MTWTVYEASHLNRPCKQCGGLTDAEWNFATALRFETCARCRYVRIAYIPPVADLDFDEARHELLLFIETKRDAVDLYRRLTGSGT